MSALCLVLLLSGCSATGSSPASHTSATTAMASTDTTTPTTTPTTPAQPITAMGRRCGVPDVASTIETVAGPDGATLSLASVGAGSTVALLLHETGSAASCGWWPYAAHLAASGVRVVMLDFCQYGRSRCDPATPFAFDYADQVARAVGRLRTGGARRVVLVGASLGGTVAVVSAAKVRADAVIDLSGFGYGDLVTSPAVRAMSVPLLAAASPEDGPDTDRLAADVTASRAPVKRFVRVGAGHGWSMVLDGPFPDSAVSPLGLSVIAWVKGDYR
ncbi:MAG: alpha/beta hydrolase [Lapillicoccus sp.]